MADWTRQVDRLFTGRLAQDALYRAGGAGAGVAVKVVPVRRDMDTDLLGQSARTDRLRIDVRTSEVAAPAINDTFTIGARAWKVMAPKTGDALGLVWSLDCAPA